MARTSKKKQKEQIAVSKHFHVGIYARLSVDSDSRKNESIDTQIAIAKQYVMEHSEMELYECYTDLGKTGTNFRREGFERMMQDVRRKRIDCVVVKDLSRFGRNHIETGNYIQKIFPFMNVRFVAVTDGIDTYRQDVSADDMALNLKNLVNEMYARDIAVKVRSSRRSKQEQGSYTGGLPPYGYDAEWIGEKKRLIIKEEMAGIVREIYRAYLMGKNLKQIAEMLYLKKIHRPKTYQKTGHIYQQEEEVLEQWSIGTVKLILTNPVYMGCLVQGATSGKQYRIRNRHDIDSGDFSVCFGTHEAIVSEEDFFAVAAKLEKSTKKYCNQSVFSRQVPVEEDSYAGVLFCGDCGKRMARVTSVKQFASGDMVRYYGYHCPDSGRMDERCCLAKSIGISVLNELVRTALKREFSLSEVRSRKVKEEYEKWAGELTEEILYQISQCEKQIVALKKQGSEDYLQYHTGRISREEYRKVRENMEKAIQDKQEEKTRLGQELDKLKWERVEKLKFLRNLMMCNGKTIFIKEVIHTLIRRIDVYPDHRVAIRFAFRMNELFRTGKEGSGHGV